MGEKKDSIYRKAMLGYKNALKLVGKPGCVHKIDEGMGYVDNSVISDAVINVMVNELNYDAKLIERTYVGEDVYLTLLTNND